MSPCCETHFTLASIFSTACPFSTSGYFSKKSNTFKRHNISLNWMTMAMFYFYENTLAVRKRQLHSKHLSNLDNKQLTVLHLIQLEVGVMLYKALPRRLQCYQRLIPKLRLTAPTTYAWEVALSLLDTLIVHFTYLLSWDFANYSRRPRN